MTIANHVPVARLRDLLTYCPATGVLTRRINRGRAKAGTVANSRDPKGYIRIKVDGFSMLGHRVAWAMHHGKWPDQFIDHINHNTSDNRIANMRLATNEQNCSNRRADYKSTHGAVGVSKLPSGRWCAHIQCKGIKHYLGSFDTFDAAIAVRSAKALELRGEFAHIDDAGRHS